MVSCGNHGAGDPSTIPFVRDILSDTTSTVYEKIRKSCIDGRDGSIAIVGPSEQTLFLADNFITCDDFDNVNGFRTDSLTLRARLSISSAIVPMPHMRATWSRGMISSLRN